MTENKILVALDVSERSLKTIKTPGLGTYFRSINFSYIFLDKKQVLILILQAWGDVMDILISLSASYLYKDVLVWGKLKRTRMINPDSFIEFVME